MRMVLKLPLLVLVFSGFRGGVPDGFARSQNMPTQDSPSVAWYDTAERTPGCRDLKKEEHALQREESFRRLSPQIQQRLLWQVHRFNCLPPEKRGRILSSIADVLGPTPAQREKARGLLRKMKQLPAERQRVVIEAIRDLHTLPRAQREGVINSDQFREMYSQGEHDIICDAF